MQFRCIFVVLRLFGNPYMTGHFFFLTGKGTRVGAEE